MDEDATLAEQQKEQVSLLSFLEYYSHFEA